MASGRKPVLDADLMMQDSDSDEEEAVSRKDKSDEEAYSGEEEGDDRQEDDGQRMTAFNLREELQEGHFDTQGSFLWDKDGKEVRDYFADNLASMKIAIRKKPVEPVEIEGAELDHESLLDKYGKILSYMKPDESVNDAIRRLAGTQTGLSTLERLKLKKEGKLQSKQDMNVLTELCNEILLRAGNTDVYEMSYADVQKKLEGREVPSVQLPKDSDNIEDKKEEEGEKPDLKRKLPSPLPEPSLDMYADDFEQKEKEMLNEQPEPKKIKIDEEKAGCSQLIPKSAFLNDEDDYVPPKKTQRIKLIRRWQMTPEEIREAPYMANIGNKSTYQEWEVIKKQCKDFEETKGQAAGEAAGAGAAGEGAEEAAVDDPEPSTSGSSKDEQGPSTSADDGEASSSTATDNEPSAAKEEQNESSSTTTNENESSLPATDAKDSSSPTAEKESSLPGTDDKESASAPTEGSDDKEQSLSSADDNEASISTNDDKESSVVSTTDSQESSVSTTDVKEAAATAEKKPLVQAERKWLRSSKKLPIAGDDQPSVSSSDDKILPMTTRSRRTSAQIQEAKKSPLPAKKTPASAAKGKKQSPAGGKDPKKSSVAAKKPPVSAGKGKKSGPGRKGKKKSAGKK